MITLAAMPPTPQLVVPMEWAQDVEHVGLVNLILMPQFDRSKEVITYL